MSIPTIVFPQEKMIREGLLNADNIHYQLSPDELIDQTLLRNEGTLSNTGALVINTGEFTGRSPKDKFIVRDEQTAGTVHWNTFNQPMQSDHFDLLHRHIMQYLKDKETWIRDCAACADPTYQLNIRVINEQPAANLFCYNMFLRPTEAELYTFQPDWHLIQAPGFHANPALHGTRQHNFAAISFTRKIILIGGTAYTGEMKKAVFTILNYLLPRQSGVLSMHCSANTGAAGDTAIFFGLSGTGKTTLSTDTNRQLIGDDEHGWTNNTIFNFEGGCYAKCIGLRADQEPEIFKAIRHGALVENVGFDNDNHCINFNCGTITENTRASYPLSFISNARTPSIAGVPNNIFFLTCDAYGVLPPISKLTPEQAMYQFISGYTAKVAGTETGITEPKSTFSACFGAPFLPLHPATYADLLGQKIRQHNVQVWLINTGWTAGAYAQGHRIPLTHTRAMITAVLEGKMQHTTYEKHPVFGMDMPTTCPGVPPEILNPRNTWPSKTAYDKQTKQLAGQFIRNFDQYASGTAPAILAAAPKM